MLKWFRELDVLLRGQKTEPELLAEGTQHLRPGPYVGASILLGVLYGLFMGLYAVLNRTPPAYEQLLASALKVPALFYLTLLVTFPSLYVFSALVRARVGPLDLLRVVIASLAVNLAVLASLGPITAFFTLTTRNYHFIKLLNVSFFAIAGVIGLGFLLNVLRRLEVAKLQALMATRDEAEDRMVGYLKELGYAD